MIYIKAILRSSGKAIVDKGGMLIYIEPPYDLDDITFVDVKDFELSISELQYEKVEIPFQTFDQATDYLVSEYSEWKNKNGVYQNNLSDSAIFHNLSSPFIEVFIEDLKSQLNAGNYKEVLSISKELLVNDDKENLKVQLNEIRTLRSKAMQLTKSKIRDDISIFPNIDDLKLKKQVFYSYCTEDIGLVICSKNSNRTQTLVN